MVNFCQSGVVCFTGPDVFPAIPLNLFELQYVKCRFEPAHHASVNSIIVFVTGPVNEIEVPQHNPTGMHLLPERTNLCDELNFFLVFLWTINPCDAPLGIVCPRSDVG